MRLTALLLVAIGCCARAGAGADDSGRVEPIAARLEIDRSLSLPVTTEAVPFTFTIRVMNRGTRPVCIPLLDTLTIEIVSPDGSTLPMDGGRNATSPGPTCSAPVPAGDTIQIDRSARLLRLDRDSFRMIGDDGFGGIWHIDGLRAGRYWIRVVLDGRRAKAHGAAPSWHGKTETPYEEVTLR